MLDAITVYETAVLTLNEVRIPYELRKEFRRQSSISPTYSEPIHYSKKGDVFEVEGKPYEVFDIYEDADGHKESPFWN